MKTPRVAIYARVSTSTHEGKQDPETQLRQLRQYAAARGFMIIGEFIDYATGRNEGVDVQSVLKVTIARLPL